MPPRWLSSVVARVRELAAQRWLHFTIKALHELAGLGIGLDEEDACDVLGDLRVRYRLLRGDEIRSIRERRDPTQAELARLLRLGGNIISRWEADRDVQTASMDMLRAIRDVPGSLDHLRKHAA